MIKKRIFACLLAVGLTAVMLAVLSRLVMPKYTGNSREGNLISEYYRAIDSGESHDVIFIGDCEAYSSFSPPVLWENYRLRSFVRGSPSQSIAQSYHILCETLEYELPRVVVLSVYALCHDERPSEAYNRMTLDSMLPSMHKVRAVRDSIREGESQLSYFLPLLRFHSRWSELGSDDIKYFFDSPSVSHNGYLLRREIEPFIKDIAMGELAPHALPQENFEYLDKIRQVCADSGITLLLVKAPTDSWRYPWYEEWSGEIRDYTDANELEYYDLTECIDEIGIDPERDSYDGGLHLNVYGAEKTTRFLGGVLSRYVQDGRIDGSEEKIWAEKLALYYKERNMDG